MTRDRHPAPVGFVPGAEAPTAAERFREIRDLSELPGLVREIATA